MNLDAKLVGKLTNTEDMAEIAESGVSAQVFEVPVCGAAYKFAHRYWAAHGTAPTCEVLEAEFPGLSKQSEQDSEVAIAWLIERLRKRHQVNQGQEILRNAAEDLFENPLNAMRSLEEAVREVLGQSGNAYGQGLYTDIAAMLDDSLPEPPKPEILHRTDGIPLFYRGEVNILFGDPEHGKTWVGLAACAEELGAGGRVLVADLDHNGAGATVARLLALGAPKDSLRDADRFRHCEPSEVNDVMQMVTDSATWKPDVAMVDSTGELMPMFNASSDSGDDFTRVHNRVLQPLANCGAAVLLVDHLAKGKESRGFGPGGSMAKRRTVGGLSLRVVRERTFTRSDGGSAQLLVNKDRHGGVRDHCAATRPGKENDEQLAGLFVLETSAAGTTWRVTPPQEDEGAPEQEFRPTTLMERASRAIEEHPGELTRNKVVERVGGRKQTAWLAVELLEREKFVTKTTETYPRYTSAKAYRQTDDPLSKGHFLPEDQHQQHQGQTQNTQEGQSDE